MSLETCEKWPFSSYDINDNINYINKILNNINDIMSDNVNDKRDHNISSREGANLMQSSGEVAHGLGKVPCGSHRDQTERSRSYPWGVCPGVVNDIINIRNDTVDDKKAA